MISKSDLQAVLEKMRAEDRRTRVEPPTVEEMLAYRNGELSGDDETRVRELLLCWPELLRALMNPYPEDDAESLPAEVVERQWKAMQERIGADKGARILTFRNALTAIAASLALVLGGVVWRDRIERSQPRALVPQTLNGDTVRGPGGKITSLATTANEYLLLLTLSDEQVFERYRIEIAGAAGQQRPIWGVDVARSAEDQFAVIIPHAALPDGRYKLILYGINGDRKEQLETYTVSVHGGA